MPQGVSWNYALRAGTCFLRVRFCRKARSGARARDYGVVPSREPRLLALELSRAVGLELVVGEQLALLVPALGLGELVAGVGLDALGLAVLPPALARPLALSEAVADLRPARAALVIRAVH